MSASNYYEAHTEGKHVNGRHAISENRNRSFQVRSEEVEEIMSRMPHWIIRRGTGSLLMIMLLLITGAWFIHYPDVIVTRVNIISSNPPVKIVAASSGKIQQVFVSNNVIVNQNQVVCLLENPARYEDIVRLKSTLFTLDTSLNLSATLTSTSFDQFVQLGELHAAYADLWQAVNQYQFFRQRNFVSQKLAQLKSQVGYQAQLTKELHEKDRLLKQQLMLERKKFLADSSLVADKVIAPLEFENSRKELITKQINADATKASILQNKLQQTEYLKTITDLQQEKLQLENDLQQHVRESVKRLLGQLSEWEQKYLIKSPVEGKAVFFRFWKENQYVNSGEALMMIVPPVQRFIARSSLPVDGAGKVRTGQKVLIKLSSYPFREFGMIRGKVASVSSVAMDTAYAMEIALTHGLVTTTQKHLSPKPHLQGIAEVLTNDKNILERLFERVIF